MTRVVWSMMFCVAHLWSAAELFQIGALAYVCVGGTFDHVEVADLTLAGEFVKGDRADLRTAGAERDAQHFEVALHLTALARGTVLDDVGVVEAHLAAEHANGKFVLVNFRT